MNAIERGMLVTSANAPEGEPSWVGVVVATNAGTFGAVVLRGLGFATEWVRSPITVRCLSDAEAVALAEMLVGGEWKPFAGDVWSLLGSGTVDEVVMLAAPHQWRCLPEGRVEIVGRAASVDEAKASASRALVAYTCGWRDGK